MPTYSNPRDAELKSLPAAKSTSPATHIPATSGFYFPVSSCAIRGCDTWGNGAFGASRDDGARKHMGVDLVAPPGASVVAPCGGTVRRIGYPYKDNTHYKLVEIESSEGYVTRAFYVEPSVKPGQVVVGGQTLIGTAQDLTPRYPGITNHIHFEVVRNLANSGSLEGLEHIDPTCLLIVPAAFAADKRIQPRLDRST